MAIEENFTSSFLRQFNIYILGYTFSDSMLEEIS